MKTFRVIALIIGMAILGALPAAARVHVYGVTITDGPKAKTASTTATFTFTINPGWGVTDLICDLDGKLVEGCTSPKTFTGLTVGEHTFTVTAYAVEIGVGKDSWTWIVDSPTPDFFLKANATQLPLSAKVASTSATPVTVQIVRLGGSSGPVTFPGTTQSGNGFIRPVATGVEAKIIPNSSTNPSAFTVSLTAKSWATPVINKSFTVTVAPGSAAVGSTPHNVVIPYAVVDEYDLILQGIDVTQGIQPEQGLKLGPTVEYDGVKLVKDKRTKVRVFAGVASPLGKNVSGAYIQLNGWWYLNGIPQWFGQSLLQPSATLSPIGGKAAINLSRLQTTPPAATFTLPAAWTEKGPILLEAKVMPPSLYKPAAESECSSSGCAANNSYKLTKIPFIDTGYVNVWALWLKLRGGFAPCCPKDQVFSYLPSAALSAAQQLMPLADGELRDEDDFRAQFDATTSVKLAMTSPFGCPAGCSLNPYLIGYSNDLEFHQVCPGEPSCPDVVMSMIDDTPLPDSDGNGAPDPWYAPGLTSSKTVPSSLFGGPLPGAALVNVRRPLTSVAHELGHSLSLLHASWGCKGAENGQKADLSWPDAFGFIHGLGVDVRNGTTVYEGNSSAGQLSSWAGWSPVIGAIPPAVSSPAGFWYDFMSYCPDNVREILDYPPTVGSQNPQQGTGFGSWKREDAWISVRNWNKLQAFLTLLKSAHAAQSMLAPLRLAFAAEQETLRVSGFVDNRGRVVLTRIRPRAGEPSTAAESGYELVLRTRQGGELKRWPLTVTSSEGHGEAATFLSADVPLSGVAPGALPADLAELQVVSGGTVLARVVRSGTAPTVRVLAPVAGEHVGTAPTTEVRWAATDRDPDANLLVAVDYSTDNGKTWDTVYEGPNTGEAQIPSGMLSMSSLARFRIRVSDGFDETSALSEQFVAVGRPPRVTILSPRSLERSRSDGSLYLAATAYDDEGAFLDGDAVTWYDGARLIAHGRLASVTGLVPGIHVLRAVAQDSKRRTGTAAVQIRIVPSAPAIILSHAPATVSQRARSVALRVACSLRARLSVAGPERIVLRGTCAPETRTVAVPIRPGGQPLLLELRAEAQGHVSKLTLVFTRT